MSQPDDAPKDLADELRALISQWETQARAARLRAEQAGAYDIHLLGLQQGLDEAFRQAAKAVRALLGEAGPTGLKPVPPPQVIYQAVPVKEVQALLSRVGLNVRTLYNHSDNAFSAVFARLNPMTQEERLQALQTADPRIVLLDFGKMPDSNEFYIDFAFGPPDTL